MQDKGATDPCPVAMRGIVPSLNTPFEAGGAVDEPALRRLVEETIAAGCQGMLAIAVAGEQASLSLSEKDRIARIITETAAGRIPVIVSVTAPEAETSRQLSAIAATAGADGICCQAQAGLAGQPLTDFFAAIADCGPELLMIQDLDWTGSGLELEEIGLLFERLPAFRCLKIETVAPGPKYTAVLELTGGRLHVSGGWAVRELIDALGRGVHAFMPTAMDRIYCAIHAAYCAGETGAARALFARLAPVLAFSNRHIDVSIRFLKMLRHGEGLFSSDVCRPPVRPLDEGERREAARLIGCVSRIRSDLAAAAGTKNRPRSAG